MKKNILQTVWLNNEDKILSVGFNKNLPKILNTRLSGIFDEMSVVPDGKIDCLYQIDNTCLFFFQKFKDISNTTCLLRLIYIVQKPGQKTNKKIIEIADNTAKNRIPKLESYANWGPYLAFDVLREVEFNPWALYSNEVKTVVKPKRADGDDVICYIRNYADSKEIYKEILDEKYYNTEAIKEFFMKVETLKSSTEFYTKLPEWIILIITDDDVPVPYLYYTGDKTKPEYSDFGMSNREQGKGKVYNVKYKKDASQWRLYKTFNNIINANIKPNGEKVLNLSPFTTEDILNIMKPNNDFKVTTSDFTNYPYLKAAAERLDLYNIVGKSAVDKDGTKYTYVGNFAYPPYKFNVEWPTGKFEYHEISSGKEQFDSDAKYLKLYLELFPNVVVEIIATTDNIGNKQDNQTLSDKRANTIKKHLEDSVGITSSNLKAKGMGQDDADTFYNGVPTEDPKFRRVYLQYMTKQE